MNGVFEKVLRVTAATLLVTATCGAAEIEGDSFKVTLPSAFGAAVKTSVNKDGIETSTWVSKAPTGEAVVVSVSKMPAKIADPVKLIDSTRDSLLKSVNGTLESEENVPGDVAARRLLFRSGTAFLRSRLAVDGDRLYDVLYVGRSEEQRAVPAVAQIFDSFQITPAAMQSAPPAAPAPPAAQPVAAPAPPPPHSR